MLLIHVWYRLHPAVAILARAFRVSLCLRFAWWSCYERPKKPIEGDNSIAVVVVKVSVMQVMKVYSSRWWSKAIMCHPRINCQAQFAKQEAIRMRPKASGNHCSSEIDCSFHLYTEISINTPVCTYYSPTVRKLTGCIDSPAQVEGL